MARTTPELVKKIFPTNIDVVPFIEAASVIVEGRLGGSGLSALELAEIERWLTAHFLAIRKPQKKSQTIGGASESYNLPNPGIGIAGTAYGQQAIALDSSGTLANIGKSSVSFKVMDISLED